MLRTLKSVLATAILATAMPALAQDELADIKGSKDHALVGRFEGSVIASYDTKAFDEVKLFQAPVDEEAFGKGMSALKEPAWLKLEGKVTKIEYRMPEGRSELEVLRNHESDLEGKGFQRVFSCSNEECYAKPDNFFEPTYLSSALFTRNELQFYLTGPVRYSLFRADQPTGTVHVAILLGQRIDGTVRSLVTVVEAKPMDTGKIKVIKASELEEKLDTNGSVDIYGIFFDFNKDAVKPESTPTIVEIAKLLRANPDLKLSLVGHTDNVGTDDYNFDLSERRAGNVVAALAKHYGIDGARMTSSGEGARRPVAPNDTDANRARNRRVELIKQN